MDVKAIKILFIAGLSMLMLSCDDFINSNAPAAPPETSDPKCLSITGSRFEKYYLQLDPASYSAVITLSSPSVLGFEYSNGIDPASYGFNAVTLADIPLKRFTENTAFPQQATGTVAVSGRSGSLCTAYSMPFEKSALISPYRSYNNAEPLNILNSFTNTPGDLTLAYTGEYNSAEKKQDFRIFSMALPSDFLKSCVSADKFTVPYGAQGMEKEFAVDGIYPSSLTASGSAYVSLIPVKRNFYQYKNITLTFSPGSAISGIEATSIVKDYEYRQSQNELSIIFNDYDFPYIGNVLFYKIKINDRNEEIQKSLRIEG